MITTLTDRGLRKAAARCGYMISDSNNFVVAGEKFDFSAQDVRNFLNQCREED